MDRKTRLVDIFQDTQQFYNTNPALAAAVAASKAGTKLYDAGAAPALPANVRKAGTVSVTKSKTFEAAMRLAKQYPGKKIAVLNFASASRPGGGVKNPRGVIIQNG